MKEVFILADLYDSKHHLDKEFIQEWESRESIERIQWEMEKLGFRVSIFEPFLEKEILLEELKQRVKNKKHSRTILFNLVEGFYSRNREGYVPSLAEFFGFPYTGSDSMAQAISLSKDLSLQIAKKISIPTADGITIFDKDQDIPGFSFPVFIKPEKEGSSLGINKQNIISNPSELKKKISELDERLFPIRVEAFLPKKEYTVGLVMENSEWTATRVAEVYCGDDVYGENVKSKSGLVEEIRVQENSSKMFWIQNQSIRFCKRIGAKGYARLDWKEDWNGNPRFLEANLTPGLSFRYSSLPICYSADGRDYGELISSILESAMEEYEKEDSRLYGKGNLIFF